MKRTVEIRPRARVYCDLRGCRAQLDPHGSYPVLRECRFFAGVRVFCCDDHREEYETRLVLANTRPRRGEADHVPGVPFRENYR